MKKALLAEKIGMTQWFNEKNDFFAVTVLKAGPCVVTQIKKNETDGYNSIQVGFGNVKKNRINKPQKEKFLKIGVEPKKKLCEFRLDDISAYSIGDEIKVDIFDVGNRIDVSGISKGKGYQGVIKRHGHQRGPTSHGSKYHRGVGSMSSATTPGKVKKGKKMPGHMGMRKVTVQNLEILKIYPEKNLLLVKGCVPGPKKSLLFVKSSVKV
jgi:large subunit ribosomal protein L3